jgi:hypothetical protein
MPLWVMTSLGYSYFPIRHREKSATGPRDPHAHTDWLLGVKELKRWPNNWGLVTPNTKVYALQNDLLIENRQ